MALWLAVSLNIRSTRLDKIYLSVISYTDIPQNGSFSSVVRNANMVLLVRYWSALYPIGGQAPSQDKHFPFWKSRQLPHGKAVIVHTLLIDAVK